MQKRQCENCGANSFDRHPTEPMVAVCRSCGTQYTVKRDTQGALYLEPLTELVRDVAKNTSGTRAELLIKRLEGEIELLQRQIQETEGRISAIDRAMIVPIKRRSALPTLLLGLVTLVACGPLGGLTLLIESLAVRYTTDPKGSVDAALGFIDSFRNIIPNNLTPQAMAQALETYNVGSQLHLVLLMLGVPILLILNTFRVWIRAGRDVRAAHIARARLAVDREEAKAKVEDLRSQQREKEARLAAARRTADEL